MSRVRLRRDLFLGIPELKRLMDTFQGITATRTIIKQLVQQYGIVRKTEDEEFTSLKIVEGTTPTKISIQSGIALDADIEIINVEEDVEDILTIPGDSVTRYVKIRYDETPREKGRCSVAADGTVIGTGLEPGGFAALLRGLPDFPSKIRFPFATENTGEYIVSNILNTTTCILNGVNFAVESDLEWEVLGTFTPGVGIPFDEKDIYRRDSYSVFFSLNDTLLEGTEFLLAEVSTDGSTMTIVDRRNQNLQLINEENLNITSAALASSVLVGFEEEKYSSRFDHNATNQVQVGWGFRVDTYTANPDVNQITVSAGQGGIFKDLSYFTDDDFDNWRCYFSNGQYLQILSSVIVGPNVILTFANYDTATIPITGDIVITPDADEIQFRVRSFLYENGDEITPLFGIATGRGTLFIQVQETIQVTFRLKKQGAYSSWSPLGDGEYYPFDQFDDNGSLIGSYYELSSSGVINTQKHPTNNFYDKKAWINRSNIFTNTQTFTQGTDTDNTSGTIDISDADGNSFRVSLVQSDVEYMTTLPIGTEIDLLFIPSGINEEVVFLPSVSPPSGYLRFYFPYDAGGLGALYVSFEEFALPIKCKVQQIGSELVWAIIAVGNRVNVQEAIDELNVDVAQNAADIATIEAVLEDDWITVSPTALVGDANYPIDGTQGAYKVIGSTVFFKFSINGIVSGAPTNVQIDYPYLGVGNVVNDSLMHGTGLESQNDTVVFFTNATSTKFRVTKASGTFVNGLLLFTGLIIYELD